MNKLIILFILLNTSIACLAQCFIGEKMNTVKTTIEKAGHRNISYEFSKEFKMNCLKSSEPIHGLLYMEFFDKNSICTQQFIVDIRENANDWIKTLNESFERTSTLTWTDYSNTNNIVYYKIALIDETCTILMRNTVIK